MTKDSNPKPPGYPNENYGYPNGSYGYPQTNYQDERPINWRKYLFLFLSNWYWFMITLGIALGIAFFKIRYSIPQYQATATLIIEEDESSQDIMNEIRSIRYFRRRADMANEVAKLTSYSNTKRAIDSLKQNIFWTAYGRVRVRPLYKNVDIELKTLSDSSNWYKNQKWFIKYLNGENYHFYQEGKEVPFDTVLTFGDTVDIANWKFVINRKSHSLGYDSYSFIINDPVSLANYYNAKLQVHYDEKEGTLLTLSSVGVVGEREADFLNTVSAVYIQSGLERKQQIAENTFSFIDNQINVILDSLTKSEEDLLTYRLSNNVINLSREGEIAYTRLKSFQDQKTQIKLNENYYNYLSKYIEDRNDPKGIIAPSLLETQDQTLRNLIVELQKLYEERENLDYVVKSNNPGIESINSRISSVRIRILEVVQGLIDNNNLTKRQIETEEQAVLHQLKKLPVNEQQLLNIRRKYDLYNQFYTFLLEKRAEAGIQKASTISNVRLLDPARHDKIIRVGNDKSINLLLALLIALAIPSAILLLIDIIDNRIKEKEDITNNTNLPILGIIGHSQKTSSIPVFDNPNSPFSESLRRIRANLQFLLRSAEKKTILVTSSVSGEGKTFTATNLAAIFASNNKKVILIGCDLRRPALHRLFDTKNDRGLSSIIIGQSTLEESIKKTHIDNLFLLPSGPIPPNPAELLETKEIESLFLELKEQYDYIILDTPPIALVSDSLSLARYADTTLYVIRQNYSRKDVVKIASQMGQENRLPSLGLLINDIKPSKSMGYNYYYGYNKGYNYGYYHYTNYYSQETEE